MTIVFDMDGTLNSLYSIPHWLEMLRAYDPTPYTEAEPMWDMSLLAKTLDALRLKNVHISICSWLSKEPEKEFDREVRNAKKEWLKRYGFPYDDCHIISYGTNKWDYMSKFIPEDEVVYLIDDEAQNRFDFDKAIDPTKTNIIEWLAELLEDLE